MDDIQKLRLDSRSLIYSFVELSGGDSYYEFYMGGIPNKYDFEGTDGWEFVEDNKIPVEIKAQVTTYSVGCGEPVCADDNELMTILCNEDAIINQYGIDIIQSDNFTQQIGSEEEL